MTEPRSESRKQRTESVPDHAAPRRFQVTVLASFLSALILCGCSKYYYNPAPQVLPQYIQKLAIRTFANHTLQFRLEDKLTLAVQSLFNQDGRYQITTEDQADGVIIGDITKYIREPLAF